MIFWIAIQNHHLTQPVFTVASDHGISFFTYLVIVHDQMSSIRDEESIFPVLQPLLYIFFNLSEETRQVDDHARAHNRFTFFMRNSARQKMKVVLEQFSIFLHFFNWPWYHRKLQYARRCSHQHNEQSHPCRRQASQRACLFLRLPIARQAQRSLYFSALSDSFSSQSTRISFIQENRRDRQDILYLLDLESRINAKSRVKRKFKK